MKIRTFTTFIILVLFISTAFSQRAKKAEVGVKAGFGTPWVINQMNYGLPEMEYEYFWGYGFYGQLGYNFTESFGLFAEIGYHKRGQRYYDNWRYYNKEEIQRKISMNYFDIPLLLKYSYGNTKARFRMLFGPQLSFLSSAKQTYTKNGQSLEGQLEEEFPGKFINKSGDPYDPAASDIKDRFATVDVALVLDLGADMWIKEGSMYWSAGARYWFSMKDLNIDAYRIENPDGFYAPSHLSGIFIYGGFHYIINGSM